jgi:galactonate dehydratase
MNAMTMHLAAAIPNFSIFETVSVDVPWRRKLVKETLVFEDGDLRVPTAPGLGVELIEENFDKFPYQPTDLPLFDGSMNVAGVAAGESTVAPTVSGKRRRAK